MFRTIHFGFLLFLVPLCLHSPSTFEDGILPVRITDAAGNQISNITITCDEKCSPAISDSRGIARIKLPPQKQPGEWVTLRIVNSANTPFRMLISPWNDRVIIPPFEDEANNTASVVVIRKGDKQILSSGVAIEAIIQRTLKAERPKIEQQIAAEERRRALQEQADEFGLTLGEVADAIREWGQKAKDPYQQGLAALFDGDYAQSNKLFEESKPLRRDRMQKAVAEYANVLFFNGRSLYGLGKYSEAVAEFREVDSLRKDDAEVLDWLGLSLNEAGRYAEAEPFLKRALEINETALDKNHPDTAVILNHLAHLYMAPYIFPDGFTKAEPLLKRALEINEKALGKDHGETCLTLDHLAGLYSMQQRHAEAEPLFKRALEISERVSGKDHLNVATILSSLAASYSSQGRYTEAEPLFKRSVEIYERVFGKDHPIVADNLIAWGVLYASQRRYTEAEPLFKRSLEIREKVLGKEHPDVAVSLGCLATLLISQGRYAEAEPFRKRALEIYEKHFGQDHIRTVGGVLDLGELYYLQGKYVEAEPFFKRALEINERMYGKKHLGVAIVLEYYATLLRKLKREDEAVNLEARAKEIRTNVPVVFQIK